MTDTIQIPSPPLACRLTEPELRARRAGELAIAARAVREVREMADGFAYRFDTDSEMLGHLFHVIDLERRCCPFLRFRLTLEPDDGPVWLEISGPADARSFIASLFLTE